MPGPGGCLVETPPGRLLLRAVRILLECILVTNAMAPGAITSFQYGSFTLTETDSETDTDSVKFYYQWVSVWTLPHISVQAITSCS